MPTAPPLLDLAGVCARLSTTERHVRELVYRRAIPFVKVGGRLRFDPRRIDAWLDAHSTDVAS